MSSIEQAAKLIAKSKCIVAFTGAGVSAESGIPTFRDPGGLWDQFDPEEMGTSGGILQMIKRKPEIVHEFLGKTLVSLENAQPNPGHYGLAELEKMGLLKCVVTQNVDDLHSIAGNNRVFEVHGNLYRYRCMICEETVKKGREFVLGRARKAFEIQPFNLGSMAGVVFNECECGGSMRIDVVMFGEAVQQMPESIDEAEACDLMLVLGTSGLVYPAANVPIAAKRAGAKVIEINPTVNAFDGITDIYIDAPSGKAMPEILDLVKELR